MPTYATLQEATKNIGPHRVNLLGIDLDFLKPPKKNKDYFETPNISTLTEKIKSKLEDKEKKEIEAKAKPDQLKYINSSLREEYYIVKIAGKGNFQKKTAVKEFKKTASGEYKEEEKTHSELEKFFHDIKFMEFKLNKDLTELKEKIIEEMIKKEKTKLLIIWDGDNFQGLTDDKPSPFTELIVGLENLIREGSGNLKVDYLALKEGKVNEYGPQFWKKNKIDKWKEKLKNENFMISYMDKEYSEVHQHTEDLCHMYIDYGSRKYYTDNKDTFIFKDNEFVKKVPNEPTGLKQLGELRKKGFKLESNESNEQNETNKRYDILIKDDTYKNYPGGSRKNNKLSKKRKHKKNTKKKNKRNTKTNIKK